MASIDLHEKANFTRLTRLLVDKGTEALRTALDAIHPPASLPTVLNANRPSLLKLKPRVINDSQWDLLFPPSGNPPDSKTFDVTLVSILFRNICGLHAPTSGWNTMPPDSDNSLQANITRIKLFRNQVYAHAAVDQVDQTTFDHFWKKISQALLHLKIPQKEIDDLRICPLGPDEEIFVQALKEWKLNDDDCKKIVADVQQQLFHCGVQQRNDQENLKRSIHHLTHVTEETHRGVQQLCSSSSKLSENQRQTFNFEQMKTSQKLAKHNFKSKIKSKVKFFHPGTREWLLKEVDHWFTTEKESRLLLITAGPGFGKSVFAAKVCEVFREKGKLAACHFCDFSDINLKNPMIMLQNLASHMCDNITGFKEKLDDQLSRPHKVLGLKDAFQIYLQNPLDELEVEKSLIVIDGLDESATDDKNEMVKLIADYFPELPNCVKVLITSRPGLCLKRLTDIQRVEIYASNYENVSDLLQYLEFSLPNLSTREALNEQSHHSVDSSEEREDDEDPLQYHTFSFPRLSARDTILHAMVKKCEGSFLYAFHAQRELSKRKNVDTMSFKEIKAYLPEGMGSVYQEYFHRFEMELESVMNRKPDLFKLLEMLVATRTPLPLKFIARALALDSDCREVKKIINKVNEVVSCLLYVADESVTVFHKSVYDWLLEQGYKEHEYAVKVSEGKKRLWLMCEQIFGEIKRKVSFVNEIELTNEERYAIDHGHTHLHECNMKESFSWFGDMIILHVLFRSNYENFFDLGFILHEFLQSDMAISLPQRQQMSWHYHEIFCQVHRSVMRELNYEFRTFYLEKVLNHSPEGCFTDCEKKLGEILLRKDAYYVKRNSIATKPVKSLLVKVIFPKIVAIGVSSNKKLAAVALKDGVICVFSLPNLVKLWQYSTKYESICCCTFAPDDSFILFGMLRSVLSVAERAIVVFFNGRVEKFKSCAFSPNGKRLVTVDASKTVLVWDVVKQNVIRCLNAGVPVDCCSFVNAGLFIIADTKNESKDSYCVWNAISFQRVDQRSVLVSKPKRGVLKSERCCRCFWKETKELIPHKGWEIGETFVPRSFRHFENFNDSRFKDFKAPTGIYNGLDCIFYLNDRLLRAIESTHFTTLATWEFDHQYSLFSCRTTTFLYITAIEDEVWLCGLEEKLVLFSTLPPTKHRSFPSYLVRILWCCFSPDGNRLATCTSDGFVNLWDVGIGKVYQRFQTNFETSSAACWWSDDYLFVFQIINKIPTLSKYPIDENLTTVMTPGRPVPLRDVFDDFLQFSGITDFSEGLLFFDSGEIEPVKVLDVTRIEKPKVIMLPGSRPVMSIAVSAGASVVLGVDNIVIILWKRSDTLTGEYDMFYSCFFSEFNVQVLTHSMMTCCFNKESKFIIAFYKMCYSIENFSERVFMLIDGNSGMAQMTTELQLYTEISKLFCTNTALVILRPHLVEFLDLNSLKYLGLSLEPILSYNSLIHSKLSPRGNVLAVPRVTGEMEFFQLHIPECCLISNTEENSSPVAKKRKLEMLSIDK